MSVNRSHRTGQKIWTSNGARGRPAGDPRHRAGGARGGGEDARTDDALADLQDVLEGTLEDVRADLGIEEVDEL
jgi:hypothetical protein